MTSLRRKEAMLEVGIDWSEEFHLVAPGGSGNGVIEIARVEHSPKAVDALVAKIADLPHWLRAP